MPTSSGRGTDEDREPDSFSSTTKNRQVSGSAVGGLASWQGKGCQLPPSTSLASDMGFHRHTPPTYCSITPKPTSMTQPLAQPQPGHRLSRIKMPFAGKPFKPKAQFSQHATVIFPSLHEDIERALATVFIFARPAGRDIVRRTDLGERWAETLGSVPGGVLFLGLTKRDDQRTQAHAYPRG